MRELKRILLLLFITLLFVFVFSACNLIYKEITLTFNTNGGSLIDDLVLKYRKSTKELDLPEDPKKYGHTFEGWFTDAELANELTLDYLKSIGDDKITLYAKWAFDSDFYNEDYFYTRLNLINEIYDLEIEDLIDNLYITDQERIALMFDELDYDYSEVIAIILSMDLYVIIMNNNSEALDLMDFFYDEIADGEEDLFVEVYDRFVVISDGNIFNSIFDELVLTDDVYYLLRNNEASLLRYKGNAVEYSIPATINSFPVYYIEPMAFNENNTLESVFIPNTIKRIGYRAFSYRSNFTINCQHFNRPATWDEGWANSNTTINWGINADISDAPSGASFASAIPASENVLLNTNITSANQEIYFSLSPKNSNDYIFDFYSDNKVSATLYDASFEELNPMDYSTNITNCLFKHNLNNEEIYYLKVKYRHSDVGEIQFIIAEKISLESFWEQYADDFIALYEDDLRNELTEPYEGNLKDLFYFEEPEILSGVNPVGQNLMFTDKIIIGLEMYNVNVQIFKMLENYYGKINRLIGSIIITVNLDYDLNALYE